MGTMIFNGISTVDMGVVIQSPPVYEFPAPDYEVTHVEGKSGDIIIDKGSYQNVKRTYYLASVFRQNTSFISNAASIVAWLRSAKGYARLEDSYEPEHYRLAMFRNPGEMVNYQDRATVLQVSFDCKPQRYLKTGDDPISITSKDVYIKVVNPTMFLALPEITIEGVNLLISFYSGEDYNNPGEQSSAQISFSGEGIIDSELQDCYKEGSYLNTNSQVVLVGGFPKLYPGTNWIKVSGTTLTKVSIKPRWWTL